MGYDPFKSRSFGSQSSRARELLEIFGAIGTGEAPPESALKDWRVGREMTQGELASRSGVPQATISQVETGSRQMTPEMAEKVAPVLGIDADTLLLAEEVSTLSRAAIKGALDPEQLARGIQAFASSTDDSQMSYDLIRMMVGTLRRAVETWEGPAVAAKSIQPETRNVHGQRIDKPHAPGRGPSQDDGRDPETGRLRRDSLGRVIRKPNDPRNWGR
jgi:transcriptional regulator with XRE-family HTH domain